jgi:hypothetical protein
MAQCIKKVIILTVTEEGYWRTYRSSDEETAARRRGAVEGKRERVGSGG